ncbi:MAG: DUF1700 domain-containing protein [Clostridiales bacterium]|nr:DUF1700 domain-containing protein [Clostridiales bacterium]
MSRAEFMERLEKLLRDIPDSEREEALQYYEDYFEDAGKENEEAVLAELGSPEQVAEKLKAGLSDPEEENTRTGLVNITDVQAESEEPKKMPPKKETNFWKVLAVILLVILAAPIGIPLAFAGLLVLAGLVMGILALVFGFVIAGFAILFSGVIGITAGIARMFVSFPWGIATAGMGCLLLAFGILATMLTVWLCIKIVPWLIRSVVKLVSCPFRKAGVEK